MERFSVLASLQECQRVHHFTERLGILPLSVLGYDLDNVEELAVIQYRRVDVHDLFPTRNPRSSGKASPQGLPTIEALVLIASFSLQIAIALEYPRNVLVRGFLQIVRGDFNNSDNRTMCEDGLALLFSVRALRRERDRRVVAELLPVVRNGYLEKACRLERAVPI